LPDARRAFVITGPRRSIKDRCEKAMQQGCDDPILTKPLGYRYDCGLHRVADKGRPARQRLHGVVKRRASGAASGSKTRVCGFARGDREIPGR